MNERLSQTLSRINVLEAQVLFLIIILFYLPQRDFVNILLAYSQYAIQISCLRAEHTQLSKSLEKESYYLQAPLDSSNSYSERRNAREATMRPYYLSILQICIGFVF